MFYIDKEIFGWFSLLIALIGYSAYFKTMFSGHTKPHAFSWFIWGLLMGIAFFAQDSEGASSGNWAMGFSALVCLFISLFALFKGEKTITHSDKIFFISALSILPVWHFTKDPLIAVILVTIIDAFAFFPTFRKSWSKPYQENSFSYAISNMKFLIAFFALDQFNWTTALYPASLVFMNSVFIILLLWRRKILSTNNVNGLHP